MKISEGSDYKDKAGTAWLGMYSVFRTHIDATEIKRKRRFVVLGRVHKPSGSKRRLSLGCLPRPVLPYLCYPIDCSVCSGKAGP